MPAYSLPVPRYWRRIGSYYRLEASRCKRCGRTYYPPRLRCVCGSRDMEKIQLIGSKFTLLDYTVLHSVPEDFEKQKPIIIGIVEDSVNNVRILSQIVDVLDISDLEKCRDVEPVFRVVKRDGNVGIICYGTKFRPRVAR
ncbi:MAG: cobalt transporter ApaG [Crenarchaeota archaeon]|nr:cobalt transporter ApaG [Thermoproteota archaeon]